MTRDMTFTLTDEQRALKAAVADLCKQYSPEYWRDLDGRREYPEAVRRRPHQGRLPRRPDPGRSTAGPGSASWKARSSSRRSTGRAATAAPATRRCTSWAPCCATAPRRRSSGYLPKIATGELRLQAFGVTEPNCRLGHHQAADHGDSSGRPLRGERAEDVHLARAPVRPHAAARPHHPGGPGQRRQTDGLSVFLDRHPRPQGPRGPAARG